MTTATSGCTPASAPNNDADLPARASDGDPAAWEEVVRRYGNLVSATVRSFRLQEADALDAVQTTWLRLAENAHHVLWPERLGGWLATTARRECLRILRQAKSAPDPLETVADTIAGPSVDPAQQAIEADTARTLWSLVEDLPPRQRTLLRALFTDHPRPYSELARTAGIPPGAIGPTLARALRQLQDRLDEHGLGRRPADNNRYRVDTVRCMRSGCATRHLVTSSSSCTPTAHKRVCNQPASSKVVSVPLSRLLT
ncbi:MAG: sigma-70 family RNA polymerase sigma factor [Pseudonocardiales bacterium]|nr:sigma-70 family RNA polymerase sigma factor [Pseudonocardiales bacterium]MBV9029640.1 sigma-70 family RNA polymerase sigma factor [Pseudonocardiales bacterium]MBW0010785.1 sigma-70 family RNA polymerase sigma factor [Pseudonocardiales bacterium]